MTYSDVGGCKEQIEKLREVVETPLLLFLMIYHRWWRPPSSTQSVSSILALNLPRVFCCTVPLALARPCVREQLPIGLMLASSGE